MRQGAWQFISVTVFTLSFLLLNGAGCGRGDSSDEDRAQAAFTRAKEAYNRGDHRESRLLLRESAQLFGHLDDLAGLAETSLLLGETYAATAEFDSAFILFGQAQSLYQRLTDRAGGRTTVIALAAAHHLRGNDREAFSILQDELRLVEGRGDKNAERELKWRLLPLCRALGDVNAEKQYQDDLVKAYTHTGDQRRLAEVLGEIGESSLARQNMPEAVKSFTAALEYANQAMDTLLAIHFYMKLGIAHDRQGRRDAAFQMFTEGLRRTDMVRGSDVLRGEMLLRVANVYLRGGNYADTYKFLNAALKSAIRTQNKLLEGYSLLQLGHLRKALGNSDAVTHYRAGADLLNHVGVPWAAAYAQSCLGAVARDEGRLGDALTHFRAAAASADSSNVERNDDVYLDCENTFYRPQDGSSYELLMELLFQLGMTDEAFLAAEMKRQNEFFRAFNLIHPRTGNPRQDAALTRFAHLRGNAIGAEQQLANALVRPVARPLSEDIYRTFVRERGHMFEFGDSFALAYPRLRSAVQQTGTTIAEAQASLPEGSTLVVYVPTRLSLQVMIVSKTAASVQVVPVERRVLEQQMREYGELLKELNVGTGPPTPLEMRQLHELSARLYASFIRPVSLNAPNASQLFVLLPSSLPFIPLHALYRDGRSNEYAVQRYGIRYLTDAGALKFERARTHSARAVVGFGNQGRTQVDVEYEVRDVKALFKSAILFFDREATFDRLCGQRGDLLHASFEVQYRAEKPGSSFVVFSQGTGYTSVKYYPVGALLSVAPFTTVLFSNPVNAGQHPLLPRLFLMNGSADIIVNSFVPQRKAKKKFNELFYSYLVAGSTTEDAYRSAILGMIAREEFSLPNMWAAYALW